MRYIALAVLGLGYTRINGVLAYDMNTKSFPELTPAQARKLIDSEELAGVLWKEKTTLEEGRFVPDEKYGLKNILLKTGCGKYRPLLNDVPEEPVNSIYNVVRVIDTDYRGRLYEIVSNTCQRIKVKEKQLRDLAEITQVGFVTIDETEVIAVDCVQYEDRRELNKSKQADEQIDTPIENELADSKKSNTGSKKPKQNKFKKKTE